MGGLSVTDFQQVANIERRLKKNADLIRQALFDPGAAGIQFVAAYRGVCSHFTTSVEVVAFAANPVPARRHSAAVFQVVPSAALL